MDEMRINSSMCQKDLLNITSVLFNTDEAGGDHALVFKAAQYEEQIRQECHFISAAYT